MMGGAQDSVNRGAAVVSSTQVAERPAAPVASQRRAWTAVGALVAVGVLNYMDRLLPGFLAEPIKHELKLSDTMLGLINGFGFLLLYAVLGLPIARFADRGRYRLVITACLGLWSAMTMLGGLAQTGLQLTLSRMGVAAGEAGSTPTAHAFVSRNFPPERRGAPIAVLSTSGMVAGMIGMTAAGFLGETLGWRATFLTLGGANLLLIPLLLVVLRPAAAAAQANVAAAPVRRGGAFTLLKQPCYLLMVGASGCVASAGYTMNAFVAPFLMRTHDMPLSVVGAGYGIANGTLGVAGLLLAGAFVDRVSGRRPQAPLWLMTALAVAGVPVSIFAAFTPNGVLAMFLMAVSFLPVAVYLTPVVTTIQRITPLEMRATASAVLLMFTGIVGGVGPLLTGMISDALQPRLGAQSLAWAMLTFPAFLVLAAVLYLLAARAYPRREAEA
jgi:predicted MFS family arabinose efflux permease